MPVDHMAAKMGSIATTLATLRGQTAGADDGFGHHQKALDPATDQAVNVVVSPFDVLRRLAWGQIVGGSEDIRLWWVATDRPLVVQIGDAFLIGENGVVQTYLVQMVDAGVYELDTTVCVCKKS